MKAFKSTLFGAVIAAATLVAAPAFAAGGWTVGGNSSGTSTVKGPTSLTFQGTTIPCTSTFTVEDTAGKLEVTDASFSGSAKCKSLQAKNFNWPVSDPSGSAPWTAVISGVTIVLPPPISITCSGSVTATIQANGDITLDGTLAPGCVIDSQTLTSTPPING